MNQPHSGRWQQRRKLAHWRAQKTCPTYAHSHSQARGSVSAQSFFHGLKPMGIWNRGRRMSAGEGGSLVKWAVRKRTKIKKSENKINEEQQILLFYCKTGYLLLSVLKCNKKGL